MCSCAGLCDLKIFSPRCPDIFRFPPSVHRGGHQAVR